MLYWLQQLQMKRWEFHNSPPSLPATPAAGLSGNGPTLHLKLGTDGLTSCHLRKHLLARPFPYSWEHGRSPVRQGVEPGMEYRIS